MQELKRRMRDGQALVTEARPAARASARLRATGRAYVHFAPDEPGLFSTAFADARPEEKGADTAQGPYGVLDAALDELVDAGVLPPERRPGADPTCWAAVHGFAALCLHGPLRDRRTTSGRRNWTASWTGWSEDSRRAGRLPSRRAAPIASPSVRAGEDRRS